MSTTSIPAFHVSDPTKIEGSGEVFISSRTGGAAGVFMVNVAVQFDPAVHDYPIGSLTVRADLSDSLKATFTASSIELVNSYGKHNPTACLTGRCKAEGGAGVPSPRGLRYWLLVADNQSGSTGQGTPDVVSFAIHDRTGNRIAYGTGPLRSGAISVAPK